MYNHIEIEKKISVEWLRSELSSPDKISISRVIVTKVLSESILNKMLEYCKSTLRK